MRSNSKYAVQLTLFCIVVALSAAQRVSSQELRRPSVVEYGSAPTETTDQTPPVIDKQPYHTLLLKNGELLSGRVYQDVDTIVLTTERAATIRIPDRQIRRFCRDRNDAFQYLSRSVDASDVSKLLELGAWALRHELFVECESMLNRLSRIEEPQSRAVQSEMVSLRQRLSVARDRCNSVGTTRSASSSKASRPAITPVSQKRAVDLPVAERALLATFTKRLQPLMSNHCATVGCHGQSDATTNQFVLYRPVRGRGHTSAQSIANLYATLEYVDQDDPLGSRLVTALRELPAHNSFLVEAGNGQIAKVERWLAQLAPSSARSTTVEPAGPSGSVMTPPVEARSVPVDTTDDTRRLPDSNGGIESVSADPYDPTSFNDSH